MIKFIIDQEVNEFPTQQLNHLRQPWWIARRQYKWNKIRDVCEDFQFRVSQDAEWVGTTPHPSLDMFMDEVG